MSPGDPRAERHGEDRPRRFQQIGSRRQVSAPHAAALQDLDDPSHAPFVQGQHAACGPCLAMRERAKSDRRQIGIASELLLFQSEQAADALERRSRFALGLAEAAPRTRMAQHELFDQQLFLRGHVPVDRAGSDSGPRRDCPQGGAVEAALPEEISSRRTQAGARAPTPNPSAVFVV